MRHCICALWRVAEPVSGVTGEEEEEKEEEGRHLEADVEGGGNRSVGGGSQERREDRVPPRGRPGLVQCGFLGASSLWS